MEISYILIYNRGRHSTTIAEKCPKVEQFFEAGKGRYIILYLLYETDNVQ